MDPGRIFNFIQFASALSILIPIICCIIKFKTLNLTLRVLFLYLLGSVFTDLLCWVLTENNIKTYLSFHLFSVFECSALVYIYLLQFEQKQTRLAIKIAYFVFLLLATIIIVNGGYTKPDNVLSSYESIFLILLSSGYFYKMMKELIIQNLNDFYFTWINTGVLIYFSAGFILFLFSGYLEKRDIKIYNTLYSLHWLTNIAYNVLLALGVWKIRPR